MDNQRHLLILDLDETLVYATETPLDRPPDFQVAKFAVYRRPLLDEFLATVSSWFDLAVWSSASRLYVEAIVANILVCRDLRFIWSNDRCRRWFDSETVEHHWAKNLKKIRKLGFELDRVLMIDDTPEKLRKNYGNHIAVKPFEGDLGDTELRILLPFLGSLRRVENVRTVEKRYWRTGR